MICLYLRNEKVRIIKSDSRAKHFTLLGEGHISQLTDLLQGLKDKKLICVASLMNSQNYFATLPKVSKKYEANLIKSEMLKQFADILEPSFVYKKVGEVTKEGITYSQYFMNALPSADMDSIIDIAEISGKELHLFMCESVVLGHGLSKIVDDETCFIIFDGGEYKQFLVLNNKQHVFTRRVFSYEYGISSIEADVVNQTIAYTMETLRLSPKKGYYIGPKSVSLEELNESRIKFAKLDFTYLGINYDHLIVDLPAIFTIIYVNELTAVNFLPSTYKALKQKAQIYGIARLICVAIFLLQLALFLQNGFQALEAKKSVIIFENLLVSQKEVLESYERAKARLDKVIPAIEFNNNMLSMPSFELPISEIVLPIAKRANISGVDLAREGKGFAISISGQLTGDEYGTAIEEYNSIIKSLEKIKSVTVTTQSLNIKSKAFSINLKVKNE